MCTSPRLQNALPQRHTRSRAGCVRCRQRRQRCDQTKPRCARCTAASIDCRYEIKLNWGGRPFRKSSFGKCQGNIKKLAEDGGFVYSLSQPPQNIQGSSSSTVPIQKASLDGLEGAAEAETCTSEAPAANESNARTTTSSELVCFALDGRMPEYDFTNCTGSNAPCIYDTSSTTLSHPLEETSFLPPMVRYLLKFYLSETIRLTVPSPYAKTEICRFVVPMALQQPCLLYAIMTFASIHLEAIGQLAANSAQLIDTLQQGSIRHLRHQLAQRDPASRAVSLATMRTLCQAQIYGAKPTWRAHLDDARIILESAHSQADSISSCSCGTMKEFLSSWYNNAEALAALTPAGLLSGQLEANCLSNPVVSFDVFGGVMSDLPDLFREVGALVKERRRQTGPRSRYATSILSSSDIALEAEALNREVHYRLQRDAVENLCLKPELLQSLSTNAIQEYALSNRGFLYTALLHIHCGVQGLPSSSPEAQHCVDQIIHCAENMDLSSGLSPSVLLVSPLFTAGLCAMAPAQERIRSALQDIGGWMKTPHLTKTLALLEQIWAQFTGGSSQHVWSWFERVNFDFIPY